MIDSHEFTEKLPKLIGQQVADMFTRLIGAGHTDNTLVHFYSDHGDHMNYLIKDTESFANERFNHFLYVMIPNHTRDSIYETNLRITMKLVSHKDIFASDMVYLGYDGHVQTNGVSLIEEYVLESRSCAHVGLMRSSECKCMDQA